MFIIIGFRDTTYNAPEPFFVGVFQEHKDALETCKCLNKENKENKEKKNDTLYEVRIIQPNKVYDYDWNVMDEDDYNQMKKREL